LGIESNKGTKKKKRAIRGIQILVYKGKERRRGVKKQSGTESAVRGRHRKEGSQGGRKEAQEGERPREQKIAQRKFQKSQKRKELGEEEKKLGKPIPSKIAKARKEPGRRKHKCTYTNLDFGKGSSSGNPKTKTCPLEVERGWGGGRETWSQKVQTSRVGIELE